MNINDLTPAMAIHPGEFLHDELGERNIKQKDFATMIGVANTQLNEVIKGKRSINAELALLIGKALSMDAVLWMNLQTNYDLDVAKIEEKSRKKLEAIDKWKMIEDFIPVAFLKKEQVITGNPMVDLPKIKEVYQVNHFDEIVSKFSQPAYAHFRKSEKLTIDKVGLVGWANLTQYNANKLNVAAFDSEKKEELVAELKKILQANTKTVEQAIQILAQYGIKLIVQNHPEKCAVDGISFWSKGKPAIGMTLRHQRIDNFAFTLMHELGHVYKHLVNNNEAQFIDIENNYGDSAEEKEANDFARNALISKDDWEEFCFRYNKPNETEFKKFAQEINVHPALLLGRYSYEKKKYNLKMGIDKRLN